MAAPSLSQPDQIALPCAPDHVYKVQEVASEWKLSIDTVQRLFAAEPDVFVIQSGRKRTLRIPQQVKERVWRRMTNKHVM
jgi:hypothetical protein